MLLRMGVLCGVLLVWPGVAAAGQSRAALLAAQRDAKARAARPVPASGLEAFLLRAADGRWPARLLNPRSGPFLRVGLSGEGAGLGVGPGWRLRPAGQWYTTTVSFVASNRRNWTGQVEIDVPDVVPALGPDRVGLRLQAGRHQRSRDALSRRDLTGEVIVRLRPALHVALTGGLASTTARLRQHSEQTGDITHAQVGTSVTFDQRNTLPPTRTGRQLVPVALDGASTGRLLSVDWTRYQDVNTGAFSFHRTTIDAQQYVPFLHGHRVLAFRALAVVSSAQDGAEVPLFLMPSAGGSRVGRAYPSFRFRDRTLVAGQVEYRYVVNPFMHGAVFVDAAQAAPRLADVTWADVRWSAGVGLRLGVRGGAALRLDLAFGREGARLAAGLGHAF